MAEEKLSPNASVHILGGSTAVFDFDGVHFVEGGFSEKNAGFMTELGSIEGIMLSAPTACNLGTASALVENQNKALPVLFNAKPLKSPKADTSGELVKSIQEANSRLFYDGPLLFSSQYTPRVIHQSAKGTLSLYVIAGDAKDGEAITKALASGDESLVEKAAVEHGTIAVLLWRPAMLNCPVVRALLSGTCSMSRIQQALDKAARALPFLSASVVLSKDALTTTSRSSVRAADLSTGSMRPRAPSVPLVSKGTPILTGSSSASRPTASRAGSSRTAVPLRTTTTRPSPAAPPTTTERVRKPTTKPRVPHFSGSSKTAGKAPTTTKAKPATPSAPPADLASLPVNSPAPQNNQNDSVICLDDTSSSDVVVISPSPSSIDMNLLGNREQENIAPQSPFEDEMPVLEQVINHPAGFDMVEDHAEAVMVVPPQSIPVEADASVEEIQKPEDDSSTEKPENLDIQLSPIPKSVKELAESTEYMMMMIPPLTDPTFAGDENIQEKNNISNDQLNEHIQEEKNASSDQLAELKKTDVETSEKPSTPLSPRNTVPENTAAPGDITQISHVMDQLHLNGNPHSATLYMPSRPGRPIVKDVQFARPYYFDVVTVPHNGKSETTLNARRLQEFFSKIRSRNYVLPSEGISAEQLENILIGKRKWADSAHSAKIIATNSSEAISMFHQQNERNMQDVNLSLVIPSSEETRPFYELAKIDL